jgi:hypothetical protein
VRVLGEIALFVDSRLLNLAEALLALANLRCNSGNHFARVNREEAL